MASITGQVQTVLGLIDPADLGITLPHEHLLVWNPSFVEPDAATERRLAYEPVTMENRGWVSINWTGNLDNLQLYDEDTAIAEALRYRRAGGSAIVDPTLPGIARDPAALARISRATGLHLLMGAGYYVAHTHPPDIRDGSVDYVAGRIVEDITRGAGDTGVRAGFIGEVGCSWPLRDTEEKVLRASAAAQRETGAALMVHPGRDRAAPSQILDILEESGADLSRVIIAHVERTVPQHDEQMRLLRRGCYLEFDVFGWETAYYPFKTAGVVYPTDADRVDTIKRLDKAGFRDRILVSHDICTKHRLAKYGGHGYDHLLTNAVPYMRRNGVDELIIDALLVRNPATVFQFA